MIRTASCGVPFNNDQCAANSATVPPGWLWHHSFAQKFLQSVEMVVIGAQVELCLPWSKSDRWYRLPAIFRVISGCVYGVCACHVEIW